jgi:predicted nucleic acid-binding protein
MNVVDSSGWIAFFADTKNANAFSKPLQDTDRLIVPSIVVYEVSKVLLRGQGEEAAITAQAHMQQATIVDLTAKLASVAAVLSLELRLAMADSIILATARAFDATVWTQDEHFRGLPKVNYFAT